MRSAWLLPMGGLVLAGMLAGSLAIGPYPVPIGAVGRALLTLPGHPAGSAGGETARIVIQVVRLPRVILAAAAGAGLGLSGAVLQGLLRNPLVGPDIVGVSGGAACGGALAIILGGSGLPVVGAALAGGVAAIAAAGALARTVPASPLAVVLSGIVVSAFAAAVLALIEALADPVSGLPQIVYWLLGSFAGADRVKASLVLVALALAAVPLLLLRWRLNLLSLGEDDARVLGSGSARLRWSLIVLAALPVAAQVSVSGVVGWAGLVTPHMARMLVGPDHRRLLPASALLGATFMLGVDDLARTVAPQELPVGVVTALIGTPVFALLFWRTQARGWARG